MDQLYYLMLTVLIGNPQTNRVLHLGHQKIGVYETHKQCMDIANQFAFKVTTNPKQVVLIYATCPNAQEEMK